MYSIFIQLLVVQRGIISKEICHKSIIESAFIEMIIHNLIQILHPLPYQQMKAKEDLQKGIQQLVDLTKQDEINSSNIHLVKMPELALVMAKYFVSMSKLCLTHYHSYSKTSKKGEKERNEVKGKEEYDIFSSPPKKPLTAYILYFQERVPFFQQKYPKYTISQLTRLIAKQWKQVQEDVKRPYIERAAADRKRYQNDKKDYKLKKGFKKIDQEESNRNVESDEHSDQNQKEKDLRQDRQVGQLEQGI